MTSNKKMIKNEKINKTITKLANRKNLIKSNNLVKVVLDSCLYFLYKNTHQKANWFKIKHKNKNIKSACSNYTINFQEFSNIFLFHVMLIEPKIRKSFSNYLLDFCPNIEGKSTRFFDDLTDYLNIDMEV